MIGLKSRTNAQDGFSLVELLTTLVILGALAAMAIPSFASQREKAQDTCAKSTLMAARTAMETYLVEYGSYLNVSQAKLHEIEPAVPMTGSCATVHQIVIGDAGGGECQGAPTAPTYCLMIRSSGGEDRAYVFNRFADGTITRICGATTGGQNGGSCHNGTW